MNNTTLLGEKQHSVTLLDGNTETVTVRQLPVRELPKYLEAQDNELRMIELVCKKPADWPDKLTPDSHESLVNAIEEVNADFFSRWVARQMARQEKLMPGIVERRLAGLSPSPSGAPKLPSSAP